MRDGIRQLHRGRAHRPRARVPGIGCARSEVQWERRGPGVYVERFSPGRYAAVRLHHLCDVSQRAHARAATEPSPDGLQTEARYPGVGRRRRRQGERVQG